VLKISENKNFILIIKIKIKIIDINPLFKEANTTIDITQAVIQLRFSWLESQRPEIKADNKKYCRFCASGFSVAQILARH